MISRTSGPVCIVYNFTTASSVRCNMRTHKGLQQNLTVGLDAFCGPVQCEKNCEEVNVSWNSIFPSFTSVETRICDVEINED